MTTPPATRGTLPSFAVEWQACVRQSSPQEINRFLNQLSAREAAILLYEWPLWARAKQLPPPGDWRVWLLLAGRGFGKTRAGAEWIRALATSGKARQIALVGDTADDVRQVMVEGPSGILAVSPRGERPQWRRSLRRLDWPNGAIARCYSASDPEQLRGPEFDYGWADEIAKWPDPAAWQNLLLALRTGVHPRLLATTTPRPRGWLRELAAAKGTVLVHGASAENSANLASGFVEAMRQRLGGSPLARQELDGVLLDDPGGALWSRSLLETCRAPAPKRTDLLRVVIGVDPAVGRGETGIIAAGKDNNGMIWVLEDASAALPPEGWATRVRSLYGRWRAEAVIAEVNQGGSLVRHLLSQGERHMQPAIREVRAMRSKPLRAEPVAAAYARGRVRHGGMFDALEDQMCACVPGRRQTPSPDRLDALVWAVHALMGGLETQSRELVL